MASRSAVRPRKPKERLDTPPEILAPGRLAFDEKGQAAGDPVARVDEVLAVVVVLGEAGGDGEDVGVEDDVPRREVDQRPDEDVVGALAHVDLVLVAGSLALLVERHHDDGGAEALDELRLLDELLLALLERDGVDDALALAALEARLDDVELGRVDHERQL